MKKSATLVKEIDVDWSFVRSRLGFALEQLHEWSGGFPSAASGAPPTSSMVKDDPDHVVLTKVEAEAERPDLARSLIADVHDHLRKAVIDSERLSRSTGACSIPPPAGTVASQVAFVQWHINRLLERTPDDRERERLDEFAATVVRLVSLASSYRKPKKQKIRGGCVGHRAAGLAEPVDAHFGNHKLCRWCGDFLGKYGVIPPPMLVRTYAKGIKVGAILRRSAGVPDQHPKQKRKKKR